MWPRGFMVTRCHLADNFKVQLTGFLILANFPCARARKRQKKSTVESSMSFAKLRINLTDESFAAHVLTYMNMIKYVYHWIKIRSKLCGRLAQWFAAFSWFYKVVTVNQRVAAALIGAFIGADLLGKMIGFPFHHTWSSVWGLETQSYYRTWRDTIKLASSKISPFWDAAACTVGVPALCRVWIQKQSHKVRLLRLMHN